MVEKQIAELLEAEAAADEDPCRQRKCTSNEHCCNGHVCVDTQNSGDYYIRYIYDDDDMVLAKYDNMMT